jgi:hypothetical protein
MTSLAPSRKLSFFVVLSLADLALTRFLLERQGGGAYEWNPVASWWLAQFGWTGLVEFKLGIVLLVAALTLIVSRRRPRAAGRILDFGCAALLAVIVYSGLLVPGVYAEADHTERLKAERQLLERQLVRSNTFMNLTSGLVNDLLSWRRSLGEAVEILSSAEKARDPEWLRTIAFHYPNLRQRELLGAWLIREAVFSAPEGAYGPAQVYRELNAQFRSCFGRSAPRPPDMEGEEGEDLR